MTVKRGRHSTPYFWRDPKTKHAHIGSTYSDALGGYGPIAEVYLDDPWICIVTDKYEGRVMLLAEALPDLIKELQRLNRAFKKASESPATERDGGVAKRARINKLRPVE